MKTPNGLTKDAFKGYEYHADVHGYISNVVSSTLSVYSCA